MRAVVALAMATGISVDTWLAGSDQDLDTALELMAEQAEQARKR